MPRIPNPKSFISKKQWEALIKRVMERTGLAQGELNPTLAEKIMKHEPPTEIEYSRFKDLQDPILQDLKGQTVYRTKMEPFEQARETVLANPERYEPLPGGKTAKRVYKVEPGDPAELAEGVAFERMKMRSIPKSLPKLSEKLQKEMAQEAKTPNTVSPLVSLMAEADDIWRYGLKGQENLGKRLWKTLYQGLPGGVKQHYAAPKEYFISSYAKYKSDPNFRLKHERLATYFDNLLAEGTEGVVEKGALSAESKLAEEGAKLPYWPGAKAVVPPMAAPTMMDMFGGGGGQ